MPEIAEERRKGISRGKILVVNSCTIERVVMVQLRSDTTVAVFSCSIFENEGLFLLPAAPSFFRKLFVVCYLETFE